MRSSRLLSIISAAIFLSSCSFRDIISSTFNRFVEQAPYDVIIVPGCAYDSAQPSGLFRARMVWAKQLYDRGIAHNIIFSGAAVHTPYIESKVMSLYAAALGIPPEHTFVEIRATHSNENVFYGYRMAKQLGFKKIALATDPFQSFCYGLFSKVYASDLARLPASIDSMQAFSRRFTEMKVDVRSAYMKDFVPAEKVKPVNHLKYSFGKLSDEPIVQ